MIFRRPAMMLLLKLDKPINDARTYDYKLLDKPTYLRKPVPKYTRIRREIGAQQKASVTPLFLSRIAS